MFDHPPLLKICDLPKNHSGLSTLKRGIYEAPDAGYTVWWDDEDGKEIRVDLTEPGALYDYLVEYAAPEGVQEDEL